MDLEIKGRLALVTGASRGIGKAIALELAKEGAQVVLVARNREALEATRKGLPNPEHHHVLDIDLTLSEGLEKVGKFVTSIGSLDLLVHNLGGSAGVFDIFASAEDWKKVWHFNVGIGIELNRIFVPGMIERKWGRVVHITSRAGDLQSGYGAYSAAKAALNCYVKSFGRAVAKDNVIVSAVSPGAIFSEGRHFAKIMKENPSALEDYYNNHLPARRLGKAEEVAASVAFLCSSQAAFMSGVIVQVDGGAI